MTIGLGVEEESPDVTFRPLSESINETIDKVVDGMEDTIELTDEDDPLLVDTGKAYEDLGAEPDEQVIHRLGAIAQEYPAT